MGKIEYIYDKQKDYGYIKSIEIHREIDKEECSKFDVKLTLVKFPCWDADDSFEIIFERVSNLKIGNIENLLKVLMQITFIGDYQREDENYMVTESEYDLFSFSCKNIIVGNED
jgi:hypothetical protein